MIEQLGLKSKFYLLNASDKVNSAGWKKWVSRPGRATGIIPANTYKGQINGSEDVATGTVTFQIALNKAQPEERAYRMTKLTWENLAEIKKTAVTLNTINEKSPFTGVNMPLHKGAVRYYREKGIKIPGRLIPPEAK